MEYIDCENLKILVEKLLQKKERMTFQKTRNLLVPILKAKLL